MPTRCRPSVRCYFFNRRAFSQAQQASQPISRRTPCPAHTLQVAGDHAAGGVVTRGPCVVDQKGKGADRQAISCSRLRPQMSTKLYLGILSSPAVGSMATPVFNTVTNAAEVVFQIRHSTASVRVSPSRIDVEMMPGLSQH